MKASSSENWNLIENFTFANGTDVDRTVWESPQWISPTNNPSFFGQTSIRNVPDFGTPLGCVPVVNNAAQLYLSTYNPLSNPAGTSFLGAQIGTIQKWGLSTYASVAFEAEVILPVGTAPHGVVAALFAYNLISQSPFLHDEIDFETASKFWQGVNEAINTNVYVVTGQNMPNYDYVAPTQLSLSASVVLRIEWSAAGVSWYINKATNPTPVYTETNVPQTDMSLVLNFWVPDSGWTWAYDLNLKPTNAPGTQWTFQVNWAKVWAIPYTATVQANQTWQSTGISVAAGDTISISYQSGLWTADPSTNNGNPYDANGCTTIPTVNQAGYTLLGANMGALCGFVGTQPVGDGSDAAFLVGDVYSGTSPASGELWLCINDDLKGLYGAGLTDNQGSITVSIIVS